MITNGEHSMITNTLIALLISSRALRKKMYQCTPHMHASLLVLVSSFIAISNLILKFLKVYAIKIKVYIDNITLQ